MMYIRRILLVAGAVMLAACENNTAPDGPEGRWTLTTVENYRPPTFVRSYQPGGGSREILDGKLTLSAPDQATFVMRSNLVAANGARGAIESDTIRARYAPRLSDGGLTLTNVGTSRFRLHADVALEDSGRSLRAVLVIPATTEIGTTNYMTGLEFSR
jgi:hypothetical protein